MPPKTYPQKVLRIAELAIELGKQQTESFRFQAAAGARNIVTSQRVEVLLRSAAVEVNRCLEQYGALKKQRKDERAAERDAAKEHESREDDEVSDRRLSPLDSEQKQFTNVFGANNGNQRRSIGIIEWASKVNGGEPAVDSKCKGWDPYLRRTGSGLTCPSTRRSREGRGIRRCTRAKRVAEWIRWRRGDDP